MRPARLIPALCVLLTVFACGGLLPGEAPADPGGGASSTDPQADRLVVAVLPFANNTGDTRWDALGTGLADMMTTDLAASDALRVVERSRLAEVVQELGLQQGKLVDPGTATQVGKLVGASHLAFGSVVAIEPDLRLDVRLVSVGTGEVLVASSVVGNHDAFFELETRLAKDLLQGLPGQQVVAPTERLERVQDVATWGQALQAEDAGDLEAASQHLGGLVRQAPRFQIAQDHYERVMRDLIAARQRRVALNDTGSAEFLGRTADLIAKGSATANGRAGDEHFGLRIARQAALLDLMVKMGDGGAIDVSIAADHHADYRREVRTWLTEVRGLIDALKARRAAGLSPPNFPKIPDEIDRMADRLGMSMPEHWAFLSEYNVGGQAALFLATGDVPNRIEDLVPAPMDLDKGLQADALALVDDALVQCEAHEGRYLEREMVRLHRKKATILEKMGHKARAIAELQGVLDRYPQNDDFDSIEEDIQDLLGLR